MAIEGEGVGVKQRRDNRREQRGQDMRSCRSGAVRKVGQNLFETPFVKISHLRFTIWTSHVIVWHMAIHSWCFMWFILALFLMVSSSSLLSALLSILGPGLASLSTIFPSPWSSRFLAPLPTHPSLQLHITSTSHNLLWNDMIDTGGSSSPIKP